MVGWDAEGVSSHVRLALFKFGFSGMQQYFASDSTTLLLFSLQLAINSFEKKEGGGSQARIVELTRVYVRKIQQ
jgi:hypothetical protein